MENTVIVTRKTWTEHQSKPDILRHYFSDISIGEKMYNKLLRKAQDDPTRVYYVEVILTENDAVRLKKQLKPNIEAIKNKKEEIIKRRELS